MLKRRFMLPMLMIAGLLLSGCANVFSVPTISVSSDGQWIAFLASEEFASRTSLKLLNTSSGEQFNIGGEGSQQGAFDWHPTRPELAYFHLTPDGSPSIQISTVDNPSQGTNQFGALAFPTSFWVTELQYAPDGNHLAMTTLLLPDGALMDPNQRYNIREVTSVLYLADLTTGDVQVISLPEVFATTLAWSPDSAKIAYTAWADDNQDDIVNPTVDPAAGWTQSRDRFRVFVYDVASGSTDPINTAGSHLSPTWLDGSRLALISFQEEMIGGTTTNSIITYDISTQNSTTIVPADNQNNIVGVSASPDGTRIAFNSIPNSVDYSGAAVPSRVMVAAADGSGLTEVYAGDGTRGIVDVPVWSSDGSTLYLSFGNPPSAQITAFAEYDDTGGTPNAQILAVEVANPSNVQVIYEGSLTNSALMQYNLQN